MEPDLWIFLNPQKWPFFGPQLFADGRYFAQKCTYRGHLFRVCEDPITPLILGFRKFHKLKSHILINVRGTRFVDFSEIPKMAFFGPQLFADGRYLAHLRK